MPPHAQGRRQRTRAALFEDMTREIRFEIATGKIGAGHRFPAERDLAARFEVSRGMIREVLRALELIGLVTVKRGRDGGVFTTHNCQELAGSSFTSLLSLDQYTFPQSLEFRRIVEPRAAALAAIRATEEHLKTLKGTLRTMQEHQMSVDLYVESNRLFHRTIAEASSNPYIFNVVSQFFEEPETVKVGKHGSQSQWSLTLYFHEKIFDAIALRNFKEAEVWMEAHLAQIENDFSRARDSAQMLT